MIFKGETRDEWHAKNSARVDKWRRRDAPAIARIEARWRAECEWHPWFAWWPVEVGDGKTAWLQTVERRLKYRDKPRIMAQWYIRTHEYILPGEDAE